MPLGFYVADAAMLALAIAAALMAYRECGRRIVPRWHLLLPGVLASLATASLIAYPELRDLLQLERWTVGTAVLLVGAVRGAFMGMSSDRAFGLVRLRSALDGAAVASAQVVLAAFQTTIEIKTGAESRFEPTVEALMILTAGYLLGRSIAAWVRAGNIPHFDLAEE